MTSDPTVIANADVLESSEAIDGSRCEVSVGWEPSRVGDVWIDRLFVMPSGHTYRIVELRWTADGDAYAVHIKGVAA